MTYEMLSDLERWLEVQDNVLYDAMGFRCVDPDSGFSDDYQRASTPGATDTDSYASSEYSMPSTPPVYGPVPSPLRPSEIRELFEQRPEVELPYLSPVYGPVPSPLRPSELRELFELQPEVELPSPPPVCRLVPSPLPELLRDNNCDQFDEDMSQCQSNSGDSLATDHSSDLAEAATESTPSPTKRRVRRPSHVVMDWQRTILEQHFRERRYCLRSTRDFLATELGMAPHAVMRWFRNQRRNQIRRERLQRARNPAPVPAWTSSGTTFFTQATHAYVMSSGTSLRTSSSPTYTMSVSSSSVATSVVYTVCTHQHTIS